MRNKRLITIAAGTPVQLSAEKKLATSITFQMKVGTSGGIGYVILGVRGTETPAAANGLELVAAPTVPSTPLTLTFNHPSTGERFDLSEIWVDGAHTGDKMLVTWWEIPA